MELRSVIILSIGRLEIHHPRHIAIVGEHVSSVVIWELELVTALKLLEIIFSEWDAGPFDCHVPELGMLRFFARVLPIIAGMNKKFSQHPSTLPAMPQSQLETKHLKHIPNVQPANHRPDQMPVGFAMSYKSGFMPHIQPDC